MLDWLVGGYFADEDLTVSDNLRFGNQYGRFASCRLVATGALSGALFADLAGLPRGAAAALRPGLAGHLRGNSTSSIINDRGSTLDVYSQNSRNYAFFTHNIFHITDQLDLTFGVRYTNERKSFAATLRQRQYGVPGAAGGADSVPRNAGARADRGRPDRPFLPGQFDGRAERRLDQRPPQRGRMDRHRRALLQAHQRPAPLRQLFARLQGGRLQPRPVRAQVADPRRSPTTPGGAQALVGNLQFDPEIINAYEVGVKYSRGPITLNVVGFRQDFSNFQLNTFNGTVFLVQTINGCSTDLRQPPTRI